MQIIFLLSVILKGVGAVLEILLQVFITHKLGVTGFGTYSTWINVADLIFWVLFSGLVKFNTFYLSGKESSINKFKRRFYLLYILPALAVISTITIIASSNLYYSVIFVITGLELAVMDQSSTLIAHGQATVSLIGEYILGRMILLVGVIILSAMECITFNSLMALYVVQYVCIILFYALKRNRHCNKYLDISDTVSIKKWGAYQRADIMQAMIGQMPIVLQYFFVGAFEAGVVSIVLLVKKLINFISGPAAKVFLPEFSRLYRSDKKDEIRNSFASIMHIQMLFVGPMAVALIGFPNVILGVFAEELLKYTYLFMICSAVFLVAATLGPCGGVMQMTGNEKKDNRYREIAILFMLLIMLLFSQDRLFVLYGLCVQTTMEAVGKYIFVCRWLGKSPVSIKQYISLWVIPITGIVLAQMFHLQHSFIWMVCIAGGVFLFGIAMELHRDANLLRSLFKK